MTTAPTLRKSRTVQPVDPEADTRRAELLALAYDQRVQLVAAAQDILDALATGLAKYQELGWRYNSNDMQGADGSQWRRVPKLALLFAQLDAVRHALDWQATTQPLAPLWCADCEGSPSPGAPYLTHPCIDHDASPSSATSWLRMFGAP